MYAFHLCDCTINYWHMLNAAWPHHVVVDQEVSKELVLLQLDTHSVTYDNLQTVVQSIPPVSNLVSNNSSKLTRCHINITGDSILFCLLV